MTGLTRKDTVKLEALLLAQRRASLEEAEVELQRVHEEGLADIGGDVPDVGDEANAMLVTDLNNTMARRHLDEVGAIDAALAHLHAHDYGVCTDCGGEIAVARLRAFPTATRCTTCQSKRERLFAHGATPTL